jgi:hypothetical protein
MKVIYKLLTLTAFILGGCIIIPTPWTDNRFSEKDIESIGLSFSNKTEILNNLGQPDLILKMGQKGEVFVYKWERMVGVLFVGGVGGSGFGPIISDKALVILFDRNSHLVKKEKMSRSGDSFDRLIIDWVNKDR